MKLKLTKEDIDELEKNAPFECQDFDDLFAQCRQAIELEKLRESWADIACMETERRRDKDKIIRELTSGKSRERMRAESWRKEARKTAEQYADTVKRLNGLSTSMLEGENGLAAATMRYVKWLEDSNREARETILGLLEYKDIYDIECICGEFGDNVCSICSATAWLADQKENE